MFAIMLPGAATCPPPTFPALFLRAALPSSDSFIGDHLKLGQVELGAACKWWMFLSCFPSLHKKSCAESDDRYMK
jgi:hypothetical protein